jgi:hypothetical protein
LGGTRVISCNGSFSSYVNTLHSPTVVGARSLTALMRARTANSSFGETGRGEGPAFKEDLVAASAGRRVERGLAFRWTRCTN